MPSGLAAEVRVQFATQDKTGLVLERSPYSNTGFTNVIKVKGKYQARLQVKGDGRGGSRKRQQYSLPGLFSTAKEAAEYLAFVKRDVVQHICDEHGIPLKQDKQHKTRSKEPPRPAALPLPALAMQTPMVTTMAMPMQYPMVHVPLVAASPLPMQPLGFVPPMWPPCAHV